MGMASSDCIFRFRSVTVSDSLHAIVNLFSMNIYTNRKSLCQSYADRCRNICMPPHTNEQPGMACGNSIRISLPVNGFTAVMKK